MARQLVTGGVNIGLVSAAGAPQNLFGEAIAGIGSVIGEAIAEGKKKEEGLDSDEKKDDAISLEDKARNAFEQKSPDKSLYDTISDTISTNTAKFNEIEKKRAAMGPPTDDYQADAAQNQKKYTDKMAWNELSAEQKARLQKEQGITNFDQFTTAASAWRLKNDPKSENVNIAAKDEKRDQSASTPYNFLKGILPPKSGLNRLADSPFERRGGRRAVNNTARVFSGSSTSGIVQTPGVPTTAFDAGQKSGYTEGRTYTEKMRRMSAPSWMGVGAAAAEGYNLSVDRVNYRKQVAADLQDYYEDKFAEFDVDSTGVSDIWNASVQEVSFNLKEDWLNHQKDRDAAKQEGRFSDWSLKQEKFKNQIQELKSVNEANKAYKAKVNEGLEKDEYDFHASGPKNTDTVLGIATGKGVTGVFRNQNGDIMTGGSTPGGLGYVQGVKQYLNAPVKMIPKKNAFDYVSGVTEKFEEMYGDKFVQTQDANGNMVKRPVSMEAIKPYLMRMFDAELDSESLVRAYASVNNWEQDGLDYDAFNTAIKNGENPKDFVKQKMYEVATQLLNPYQAQREEKVTGVSTQLQKARLDQQKQNTKANQAAQKEQEYTSAAIDLLGDSSEFEIYKQKLEDGEVIESSEQFYKLFPNLKKIVGSKGISTLDISDGVATFYGKQVDRDGKKTTPIPYVLDLSQPYETILQQVANMVKETGYIQVDKKSNFRTKYNY